jgi:hypothetical protein
MHRKDDNRNSNFLFALKKKIKYFFIMNIYFNKSYTKRKAYIFFNN